MKRLYTIGEQVRIRAECKVATVFTDPTTLTFKYKPPTGAIVSKVYGVDTEVVRDSTGNFHIDLTLSQEGSYSMRWEATGAVVGADETVLKTVPTVFD
jgi:hypothetical protein